MPTPSTDTPRGQRYGKWASNTGRNVPSLTLGIEFGEFQRQDATAVHTDRAQVACAFWAPMVRETTSGRATTPNPMRNCRRPFCERGSEVKTRFCSWSCRTACSATSSVTAEPMVDFMLSVIWESVVGLLHASQAAPAVAFKAKTLSRAWSTITFEPSGRELSTREFE
ncbi:hypothetical protein SBA5_200027 [Candidatus Sulfotelmatomonas gaucii]|uniref:Uncharacterized protein n=1 Tax=Candidatus Sulfuritelmatomonas gaucii TaxID=2043161 RepID=A0A2N9L7Z8_9BACT|nr:hypothetical protein SBA5_200027 [Candidatus Sulfotelmatomonas gaucii]